MHSQHHSFDIHLAARIGIEEAILVQHFQHWIRINRKRGKNIREGHCWMYETMQHIADHFPYMNYEKVKYCIERLVDCGILKKGNFNKLAIDKTNWYAFVDEAYFGVDQQSIDKLIEDSKNLYERENSPSMGKIPHPSGKIPSAIPDTKEKDTKESKAKALESTSAVKAAELLWKKIQENFPKIKKPKIESWVIEIEKMNRIDNISWEEIEEVICFSAKDPFWCKNILSASALRRKYFQLYAKMTPVRKEMEKSEGNIPKWLKEKSMKNT